MCGHCSLFVHFFSDRKISSVIIFFVFLLSVLNEVSPMAQRNDLDLLMVSVGMKLYQPSLPRTLSDGTIVQDLLPQETLSHDHGEIFNHRRLII